MSLFVLSKTVLYANLHTVKIIDQLVNCLIIIMPVCISGVTLYAVTVPMNANPIRTAQSVCDKLISSQVKGLNEKHLLLQLLC